MGKSGVRRDPEMVIDDDIDFISRLRQRDRDAFEQLVREYGPRMLAIALRFLRQREDAEDVVQTAFISAYRGITRFDGASNIWFWLRRIVINASLMKIRTRKRRAETPIEDLLGKFRRNGPADDAFVDWREPVDTVLARNELRGTVREAIDQLPESYRTVLLMRDIEELSTADTARLLGATPGNVKVRLHRARRALRGLLDPTMVLPIK